MQQQSHIPGHTRALRALFIILLGYTVYKFLQQNVFSPAASIAGSD